MKKRHLVVEVPWHREVVAYCSRCDWVDWAPRWLLVVKCHLHTRLIHGRRRPSFSSWSGVTVGDKKKAFV